MNEFDRRWQHAIAHLPPRPENDPAVPFGFTTRVLAACRTQHAPALSVVWTRLAWRTLGSVAAALALLLAAGAALDAGEDPLGLPVDETGADLPFFQP